MTEHSVAVIGTRGYPSYYGGFETAVRHIAPHLSAHGVRVRVYGRPGASKVDDPTMDESVEVVETRGIDSTKLSTLSFGLTATLHAMRHRTDSALVMNVANGYWLPLLKIAGIRTVVNVDGIEWQREKWSTLGKFVFRLGAWLTARFADELVFDAEAIGAYWRRNFGRDGIFIPYGADEKAPLPPQPGLAAGSYVLVVARFVPENSIPQFLEAATAIADRYRVVLIGSAPEDDPLHSLAQSAAQHPNIDWLGHVSDDELLFSLWQNAGVYFHGHSVGGTNPALVQAMALGSRIVARDTVYNREVLGETGTFCEPDPASIASAIFDAFESNQDLGRLASDRARKYYNWADVCEAYRRAVSVPS
jgi:glycosyltransferase involved in cell wall biosynthesis